MKSAYLRIHINSALLAPSALSRPAHSCRLRMQINLIANKRAPLLTLSTARDNAFALAIGSMHFNWLTCGIRVRFACVLG